MNLLLFGPPGVGKGTQSNLLRTHLKLVHISTGDLFREAMKAERPLGLQAQQFINQGLLVPDSITINMVSEKLMTLKGSGFVLDGFPRNISQAEALEEILKQDGQTIDRAIFLTVPQDVLLKRLAGRRVCQRCGAAFHVENKPPRFAEQCDVCGDKLVLRSDDQEHVVVERLKAYEQNTRPLREYYEKRQLLLTVDGIGSELDVYQRLISGLQKRL